MSAVCAKKAKLALKVSKPSYMISNPGGQVVANQIVREVLLELAEQVFPHTPHCLGWARNRCHSGNELDEATQSYSRYSEMTGLPRFSDICQGYLTPPSCYSPQGTRASHGCKEYKGNTYGMRVYGCYSRRSTRNAS
jgi:hypothetical protein